MTRPLGGAFKSVQSDLKGSVGPNQKACCFLNYPQWNRWSKTWYWLSAIHPC